MKMTIDQYNLIIEIMKKAQLAADAQHRRKEAYYSDLYAKCLKQGMKSEEIVEGLQEHQDECKKALDRLNAIDAILLKLENTEI